MRKWLIALIALAALAAPAVAAAHPLGNFTINRYSELDVSGNRLFIRYVLDMAEIPTFQARPALQEEGRATYAAGVARRLREGVRLELGGRSIGLREVHRELAFPQGQAGLTTTRLEVLLATDPLPRGEARLAYRDTNFSGRLGWKEIVVRANSGGRVLSSTAPSRSVSEALLAYPKNLLQSPLDVTSAEARVVVGTAAGPAPALDGPVALEQKAGVRNVSDTGFAALISQKRLGALVILASLAAAFFWGLVHALSPGHGKAIIAAYLIGQRGRPRHAVYLGLIVTVTHTVGVFALGAVTLLLSEFIVPDTLYPWLNLVSGLLIVAIAASVFWARFSARKTSYTLGHDHSHEHAHGDHGDHHHHDHGHAHAHSHGAHVHSHGGRPHSHVSTQPGWRGLVAAGVSGGLIPCPSALVVLLAAISLHRIAFGLLLIVAFSAGLAITITGIGLIAVLARSVFKRVSFEGRLVRLLPAASALVILGVGLVMTAKALPSIT